MITIKSGTGQPKLLSIFTVEVGSAGGKKLICYDSNKSGQRVVITLESHDVDLLCASLDKKG